MILVLAWKELREQRSIWLTMVIMTGLMGLGFAQLTGQGEAAGTVAITVLAMAGTFGVVCGSMMFAGEREGGTLVFLDIFLGRRGLLWMAKLLIGLVLATAEALAVALTLFFLRQEPPDWLATLVGRMHLADALLPIGAAGRSSHALWFLALPLATLEGFAWGLLGSAFTKRVLAGAAIAVLIGLPVWLLIAFAPPPACMILRLVVFGMVLLGSCAIFMAQPRDATSAAPVMRMDPRAQVIRDVMREMYYEEPIVIVPVDDEPVPAPAYIAPIAAPPPVAPRRTKRPPQADSPRQVLLWLTFQQATLTLALMGVAALVVGLMIPYTGQVLWPIATLLLGIACGTATFAWEQSDLSYQFLAAQHFPLKTIWNVKVCFWLSSAVICCLILFLAGGLLVLLAAAVDQGGRAPLQFNFGHLYRIMGPVLFFGIWLAYGFCVAGIFVYLCHKMVYAVIISVMVAIAALGLWMPSLLSGGMEGWQLWLAPAAALVAMRLAMRPWSGGRIQERKPLAALFGLGTAALVWAALNFTYRAWEIPDAGEPLDRAAFRAALPAGKANLAGQRIQEAVEEFRTAAGKHDAWLKLLTEAGQLPLGIIEVPATDGQTALLRHVPVCREMTTSLRFQARQALKEGKPAVARERLGQVLVLSRHLRSKAPLDSYLAGIDFEKQALEEYGNWFAQHKPIGELLRQVLDDLNRHQAETPPALDCLQTECYRAEGFLRYPTTWAFYNGAPGVVQIREPWLAGGIAFSLDTPWESERKTRLWQAVWAGQFRAMKTPHWELPQAGTEIQSAHPTTAKVLHGWLPTTEGPAAGLTAEQLTRLLDASWLSDERLVTSAVPLRVAATRAQWRMDASRLTVALMLYQAREQKTAQKLDDLVPKDLPELPVDPYSGKSFLYRISQGEKLELAGAEVVQGQIGRVIPNVGNGHAILWSTGPDREDNGGRKHGGAVPDQDPRWLNGGLDLLSVVLTRP